MSEHQDLRRQLKDLRAEWKRWKRAAFWEDLPFIDWCLAPCPNHCGQCEGCISAAYRQQRMDEIAEQAAALKRQLEEPVEPKRVAATKPEQLALLS